MSNSKPLPGTGGDRYIPYAEREGAASTVYFTRDLSEAGLRKIFARINAGLTGKVAVKLHTGEPHGPNIIPRPWVKSLIENDLPGATIVETNTYYEGGRYTTDAHLETLKVNGWTFCPVDIMDAEGVTALPVKGGKWFAEMHMGKDILNYDSMFVLTHFKGHAMGGFGGSNKNIGIGCADGRIGKKEIHTIPGCEEMWSIATEEFMERMTESAKAVVDHFGEHIAFVNVMRNMSVSCDCEGVEARAGRDAGRRHPRLAGHLRDRSGVGRPGLRAQRGGPPRAGGAHGEPPRPAPADLHEGAGHGQRPLPPDRHRPRRPRDLPRRGRGGRRTLCGGGIRPNQSRRTRFLREDFNPLAFFLVFWRSAAASDAIFSHIKRAVQLAAGRPVK